MQLLPVFIRTRPGLALFALLATAGSGFGQTFFVSVFGSALRAEFALSNTAYGALYSGATVLSALVLLRVGGLADRWPLHHITTLGVSLLAVGCMILGLAPHVAVLILGFFLLRLGGQGLMAHLGLTTAGRYFQLHRGKVMALAASGFPLAEATLPAAGVALIGLAGWRSAWWLAGAALLLVLWPIYWLLARRAPLPGQSGHAEEDGTPVAGLTRRQVLLDRGFYLLLPAALITPFVVTAILFHQAAIAEARDWPLALVAGAFSGYAAGHLLTLLIAGPMVDKLTARRTLPLSLLPMMLGMVLLGLRDGSWVPAAYLTLTGMSQGAMSTASGALWPERYGTRYLGAIRAMAQAIMVVSTAISPILAGLLLDAGFGIPGLAGAMAVLTGLSIVLALGAPARVTSA
jgi:MFS family permease